MSQANTVAKKRAPITVPGKALPAKLCKSTVPDDAEANIRDQRGAKMGQPCKRMSQIDRYKKTHLPVAPALVAERPPPIGRPSDSLPNNKHIGDVFGVWVVIICPPIPSPPGQVTMSY